MNKNYRDAIYMMSSMKQGQLLGKGDAYQENITEGGNYKCFKYHLAKHHELIRQIIACEAGNGVYSSMSDDERKVEGKRLRGLEEAHNIKTIIFAIACGSPFGTSFPH